VLLVVPLVIEMATGPRVWSDVAELTGGCALLAALVALRRRAPLGVLAAAAATATVAEVALAPAASSPARVWPFAATALFAYLAGRRVDAGRPVLAVLAAVAAAGLPVGLLIGLVSGVRAAGFGLVVAVYDWLALALVLLLVAAPPWLLGRYVRQRATLVAAGWERAALLERQQQLEAERARLAERARIAQDMHDSLGHEWTLIALRAAALEVSPHLDEETRTAAGELRAGVAAATEHLRDVIGVLQPDTGPGERADVAALVERAAAAGMAVDLEAGPEPPDLLPLVRRAAYRIVQEALTNAAKHAPGAPVAVRIEHGGGTTAVTVTNGAAGTSAAATDRRTGGSGLPALRERVRLAGGTLRAGPDGDGFTVHATLPHEGTPAEPSAAPDAPAPELERARGEVRRSVAAGVRVPLLAAATVAALGLALFLLAGTANRLDPAAFDRLPTGVDRATAMAVLPPFQVVGDPGRTLAPPPRGARCRYYWSSEPTDERLIFRLCFADDRLVAKEAVPRAALSGPVPREGAP